MNYKNLIGVTFETNQVRQETPIANLKESYQAVILLEMKYDLETILKSCKRSKYNPNNYSVYAITAPASFDDYSLWDLLNS